MKTLITLSVHDIVDNILRSGSIDTRVFNNETMAEGTRMHKKVQELNGSSYSAEVPLETTYDAGDFLLDIQGRADGIIHNPDGTVIVDEIKTANEDLLKFKEDNYLWHQGQAKMYAWMLLRNQQKPEAKISVQVSYYRQRKISEHYFFKEEFTFQQLDEFCESLIQEFIERQRYHGSYLVQRNHSLNGLPFPYPSYRVGQQDLIAFSDRILMEGSKGYALAPTGIGKTVCVLYPFVKSLREGKASKIFYLTSKNSIKRLALKTINDFIGEGALLRCVAITAKETICINDPGLKKHCNPDECPFAVNYYSKIYGVLKKALSEKKIFDMEDIVEIAQRETVCPFQLSLDLAMYCDVCVYDYNYVYDPVVGNPEIKDTDGDLPYLLLVDEAHNLPGRARDMYSATLTRHQFLEVFRDFTSKKSSRVKTAILDILGWFDHKEGESGTLALEKIPEDFMMLLKGFMDEGTSLEKKNQVTYPDSYLALKSIVRAFLFLPNGGKANFAYDLVFREDRAEEISIRCLDASEYVQKITDRFQASLFFSATLSPELYYINLLGGNKEDLENHFVKLPSPFAYENRLVLVDDVPSLKYNDRHSSFPRVLNSIYQMVLRKRGNYFIFLPSYSYMEEAYEKFESLGEFVCLKQSHNMPPEERNRFLDSFEEEPSRTHLGFLVLGGVFGEGIELKSHALSGVAIVSVGLPGVGYDNNLLRDYYQKEGKDGFDYAYTFPGFNKVIQASGRVIRNLDDKGVILFIDKRFNSSVYKRLLDEVYPDRRIVSSPQEVGDLTRRFWKERTG